MPWKKVTEMSLKLEFIRFAIQESEPFVSLCSRFKISAKTGYKLLKRYHDEGEEGLKERSRRPLSNPNQTSEAMEQKVLSVRLRKPSWGGRKIHSYLLNSGENNVPMPSTITGILKRHGLIIKKDLPLKALERFEHKEPNDLWQADFKGHFAMQKGRCHPLTVLDDHSRFSLGLKACDSENKLIVQQHFTSIFEEYGLPYRINFDNGSPWASVKSREHRFTAFSIWLMRLGIQVSFSKVRRPQTNGKIERFHQTLKKELLQYNHYWGLKDAQASFDAWRTEYNFDRPHEAIYLKPPSSRYKMSPRRFPEKLPEIEYRASDIVRKVDAGGLISYRNKKIFIGEGFKSLPVALRENEDDIYSIYFCHQKIFSIDLESY